MENDFDIKILRKYLVDKMFVTSSNEDLSFSTGEHHGWVFDTKKVLLEADFLSSFARSFWERCHHLYPFQLGGLEIGALPLLAALVLEGERRGKKVNAFFVRKSRKKTGRLKRIEGEVEQGPIILVDDILNTGGSFELQYEVLRSEFPNAKIILIFALVSFYENYPFFKDRGIGVQSLFTLSDLQKDVPAFLYKKDPKPKVSPYPILFARKAGKPNHSLLVERGGVALNGNNIVFGTDSGEVYSLDKQTGKMNWVYVIPGFSARKSVVVSPLVCKKSIFVASLDGHVIALSHDGKMIWKCRDGDEVSSEMLTYNSEETLLVLYSHKDFTSKSELCSYSAVDGRLQWVAHLPFRATRRIVLSVEFELIFISSEKGDLYAISTADGSVVWKISLPIVYATSPHALLGGHLVIAGSTKEEGSSIVYKLSQKRGEIVFCSEHLSTGVLADLTHYGKILFLASQDHTLSFFDIEHGFLVKKYDISSRILCSPTVVIREGKATLFVCSNDGKLCEFDIKSGSWRSISYFTERILSAVVENEGILYVKTAGGEVAALRLL